MEINFKLSGGKELEAALKKLPDKLARKAGEAGVRAGANVIKKGIQEKAPGDLGQTIKTQKDKAGPAGINYKVISTSPYAHFPEFGTTSHTIAAGTKRGHATGKKVLSDGSNIYGKVINHPGAAATPYFRPGADEKTVEAVNKIKEVLARAINRQSIKFVEED